MFLPFSRTLICSRVSVMFRSVLFIPPFVSMNVDFTSCLALPRSSRLKNDHSSFMTLSPTKIICKPSSNASSTELVTFSSTDSCVSTPVKFVAIPSLARHFVRICSPWTISFTWSGSQPSYTYPIRTPTLLTPILYPSRETRSSSFEMGKCSARATMSVTFQWPLLSDVPGDVSVSCSIVHKGLSLDGALFSFGRIRIDCGKPATM
mmetsp:Transcript_26740/g.61036  ORF Transcript_26740/g.61036 Transcript_26740/m.61036 type:complete len:206 (+) Transcript_26740:587-1204(+)